MKKEIKNSRFDVLASKRNSLSLSTSLDENSKKIQKLRIKIKDSKLNKTMPASLQMDMKSVRVLVERTKFNVMLNSEHKLNKIRHNNSLKSSAASSSSTSSSSTTTSTTTSQSTSTITKTTSNLNSNSKSNSTSIKEKESNTPLRKLSNKNGPLASSTPQRPLQDSASPQKKTPSKTKSSSSLEAAGERSRASETVGAVEHQQTIDEIYKVRKCCIKIPKDKLLLQLQQGKQHMPYPVKLIVHKARGRAKKDKADQSDADNLLMVESPSTASTTTSSTTADVFTGTATNRDVNAGAKGASEAPSKPSIGQKRKSSEKQSSVSPPKRKTKKGNEFFIKIGALTRVPSPRRRLASNSSSPEDKPPLTSKQRRKNAKKLNTKSLVSARLSPLRQKFGIRFFKSFVKIKRMVAAATATAAASAAAFASAASNREQPSLSYSPPKTADTTTTPKKKNGKNLTVSFLETVEIFGESSDEDDWFESDAKNASRNTKPLDSLFDSLKSSTPCIRNSSTSSSINNSIVSINNSSSTSSSNSSGCGSGSGSSSGSGSGILKSSILDRKEKKSFSPLKETETESESPRKQQLKKANESFVRSSLETQVDEEERDNAEDRTEESAEKSSTVPESDIIKDDIEHQNSSKDLSKFNDSDSDTSSPSKLSANKPAAQISDEKTVNKEQKDEQLTSSNASNEDTPMEEQNASNSNKDVVENAAEVAEEEAETTPIQNEMNENEDSFKSATNTECNDSVGTEVLDEPNHSPSPSQTAENDEEMEENLAEDSTAQLETEAEAQLETQDEEPSSADQIEDPQEHEHELKQEEEEVEEGNHIDEISKDACPDDEEEPFVDPTKLVASVLLNDSTEEGRNEAQAVLNDVCQMAADESSVLLSTTAAHLAYSSPHSAMDDDDDDDFTNSVLTHPETEKTLQSAAASDLVPNSQEIAVEASVVSQAALVAPADVDVTEDTFASVVAEVERFTKDVNSEIYAEDVGITGTDVMMDNVQARHSLDDIFDDDVDDDIMSSLRMSGGSIDIGHDKSLPIQVIETEVMAIPNEPDLIFDKPLGTTASSLNLANDTLPVAVVRGGGGGAGVGVGPTSAPENHTKLFGRLFQSVKSYVMSPGGDKNSTLQD